jgi:hypothetical protein
MTKTGRLSQSNRESRLDGTLLARKGAPDPFGAATDFLTNRGLGDGDCITVTGESGVIGGTSVIFMDTADKADESLCKSSQAATPEGVRAFAMTAAASPKAKTRAASPKREGKKGTSAKPKTVTKGKKPKTRKSRKSSKQAPKKPK